MTLTPALSQREREAENSLSPRERVAEGRVRVPSEPRDGLAMIPGHHHSATPPEFACQDEAPIRDSIREALSDRVGSAPGVLGFEIAIDERGWQPMPNEAISVTGNEAIVSIADRSHSSGSKRSRPSNPERSHRADRGSNPFAGPRTKPLLGRGTKPLDARPRSGKMNGFAGPQSFGKDRPRPWTC